MSVYPKNLINFALSDGREIPLDKKSVKLSFSAKRIANSIMD